MNLPLNFDNRFSSQLPADSNSSSARRQVHKAAYSFIAPTPVSAPSLLSVAKEVAALIDLTEEDCQSADFLSVFSGNQPLPGMQPYAMCYGGHQFGSWAGQLGDGRAINLGEVINADGQHWALQLKGAGATPYSRTADGLAVLRSSVREYLCSEAMFHLGVPTTRALSLMLTGEQVMRDMLYDGHPEYEAGAVVCRVAPSFIRFGSFQIFSSRSEFDELRQLADFTIRHHFMHLLDRFDSGSKELYVAWFKEVCELTVTMIVDWMRVGFVHGVMNTDNMSILGLTIDYGPYGWLDDFNPEWTPNTTDAGNRRYRYSQQPNIALWNLYQLANSLYPIIEDTEPLEAALEAYQAAYQTQWCDMMAAKLGFLEYREDDHVLFVRLETLLAQVEIDMTLFYRHLSNESAPTLDTIKDAYYQNELPAEYEVQMVKWFSDYNRRLALQNLSHADRRKAMNKVNPKYVFRNYLAQQAIDLADTGDYSMINDLLEVFRNPYDDQPEKDAYALKRPDWAKTKVGCSMLSCSS